MEYTVLTPWAEAESKNPRGICERVQDLDGLTIGLYSHFKDTVPELLETVGLRLKEKYPNSRLSAYQYCRDAKELINDPENDSRMQEWLKGVDVVVAGLGDAGSCSMYLTYNQAHIEKLGKPTVTLVEPLYYNSARRGASARSIPGLRLVVIDLPMKRTGDLIELFKPRVDAVFDQIIDGLTKPPTEEESNPKPMPDYANMTYTGTLGEINDIFYKNGWTAGLPIIPPTEEAVAEMLTGTDLPRDHVVVKLPPLLGEATVEKIAVNAVMAGCLPTYMPVLIAAMQGMSSPLIQLEGWTCSNASWIPFSVISGPIGKAIGLNSGRTVLSPYYKPNSAIPRAIAYMVMNLTGCRPGLEDMSGLGSMGRFGVCIGDNEEESPWTPLHTDYGFDEGDSVLAQFWPAQRVAIMGFDEKGLIRAMCNMDPGMGWDLGAMFILSPAAAKLLADAGWTRQKILDYVVEYNRAPVVMPGTFNNHYPEGSMFAIDKGYSQRRFWSKKHMFIVVAGKLFNAAFTGGGDHGGPVYTKIELPKNWDALVEKYKDIKPQYIEY